MQLEIQRADGHPLIVALDPARTLRLGTDPTADVALSGTGIQPIHCRILFKDGHFQIHPSKAAGTVALNGSPSRGARLRAGDTLQLGDVRIFVRDAGRDRDHALPRTSTSAAASLFDEELPALFSNEDQQASMSERHVPAAEKGKVRPPRPGPLQAGRPQAGPPRPRAARRRIPKWLGWRRVLMAGAWILAGGGIFGTAWWVSTWPTAAEQFEAAMTSWQEGEWKSAAEKLAVLAERYPNHPLADSARARRDLARLRTGNDSGSDPGTQLDLVREILARQPGAIQGSHDRGQLADILVQLASGLVAQAGASNNPSVKPGQDVWDRASEAVALARRHVPAEALAARSFGETELALARIERDRTRSDRLAEFLALIQSPAANRAETKSSPLSKGRLRAEIKSSPLSKGGLRGVSERAIAATAVEAVEKARLQLLRDFPDLAPNTRLSEGLASASQRWATDIKFKLLDRGAATQERPTPISRSVTLCPDPAKKPDAVATPGVITAISRVHGTAYGLDAANGALLWRRRIGFDTTFVPQLLVGADATDALLIDSTHHDLVRLRASTGEIVWRQSLPPFDTWPVVAGDEVLVACQGGELVSVDLSSGKARGQFELPQPLEVGPAVDSTTAFVYQPADSGNLYVLSQKTRKCTRVIPTGHSQGSIAVPPLLHTGFLVMAVNDRLDAASLHVFAVGEQGTELKQVQVLRVEGHVSGPLIPVSKYVCVATSRGRVYTFRLDQASEEPFTAGPEVFTSQRVPAVPHLSVYENELLVAGEDVDINQFPAKGTKWAEQRTMPQLGPMLQTAVMGDGVLLLVGCDERDSGVFVQAREEDSLAFMWSWYTPLGQHVNRPVLCPSNDKVLAIAPQGYLYEVTLPDEAAPTSNLKQRSSWLGMGYPPSLDRGLPIAWQNGLTIFTPHRNNQFAVYDPAAVSDPANDYLPISTFTLPSAVAGPCAKWRGYLVAPLNEGQVALLDPRTGLPAAQPFQPRLEPASMPRWQLVEFSDQGPLVIGDGRGKLYELELVAEPQARLVERRSIDFEGSIVPLAVPSSTTAALLIDRERTLYANSALEPTKSAVKLDAEKIAWGPTGIGKDAMLATNDGELWFVELDPERRMRWRVPLTHGLPAGAIVSGAQEQELLFASTSGAVWSLDAADGRERWAVETGELLTGDLCSTPRGLLIVSTDGTLHLLAQQKEKP